MNDETRSWADSEQAFASFRDEGEPGALEFVFRSTAPELLRLARYLMPDVHAAEDAVQATFLSAIDSAGSFEAGQRVAPWLVGILTNHVRNHRRKLARRVPRPAGADVDPATDDAGPASQASARELRAAMEAALRGLTQPYREVVELTLKGGLLAREIAESLGRPAGTVRSQVARGMDMLRRALPAGAAPAMVSVGAGRGLDAIGAEVLAQARTVGELGAATTAAGSAQATAASVAAVGSKPGWGAALVLCAGLLVAGFAVTAWLSSAADDAGLTPNLKVEVASTVGDEDAGRGAVETLAQRDAVEVAREDAAQTAGGASVAAPRQWMGVCVDEAGEGIVGVSVYGVHQAQPDTKPVRTLLGTSGAAGVFKVNVDRCPAPPTWLLLSSPQHVATQVELDPIARKGAPLGELTLRSGVASLQGVVRLASGAGGSLEGVTQVHLSMTGSVDVERGMFCRVSSQRTFELGVDPSSGACVSVDRVPEGEFAVRVVGAMRASPRTFRVQSQRGAPLLEIEVEPFRSVPAIRGMVVDEQGGAVAEARIFSGASPERPGQPAFARQISDAMGRFSIELGDPTAENVRMTVFADGRDPVEVETRWGDDELRIVLPGLDGVVVRALDGVTGARFANFTYQEVYPAATQRGSSAGPGLTLGGPPANVSDGALRVKRSRLPLRLAIDPSNDAASMGFLPGLVDLSADAPAAASATLVLARTVAVRVEDAQGQTVVGARVRLLRPVGFEMPAPGTSDGEGLEILSWERAVQRTQAWAVCAEATTGAAGEAKVRAPARAALAVRGEGRDEVIFDDLRFDPERPTVVRLKHAATIVGQLEGERFFERLKAVGRYGTPAERPRRTSDWFTAAQVVWTPWTVQDLGFRQEGVVADVGLDGRFEIEAKPSTPGRLWLRQSYQTTQLGTAFPALRIADIAPLSLGDTLNLRCNVEGRAAAALEVELRSDGIALDDGEYVLAALQDGGVPLGAPAVRLVDGHALLVLPAGMRVDRVRLTQRRTEHHGSGSSSWDTSRIDVALPGGPLTLESGAHEALKIDVAASMVAGLRLELTDADGKPVAERVVAISENRERARFTVRTDAQGVASLDFIAAGVLLNFSVVEANGSSTRLGQKVLGGGRENVLYFRLPR